MPARRPRQAHRGAAAPRPSAPALPDGTPSPATGLTTADEMVLIHIGLFVLSAVGAGALSWDIIQPYVQPYLIDAGFLVVTSPGHVTLTMPWLGGRPVRINLTHLIALAIGAVGLLAAHTSLTRRRRLHLEGLRG